MRHTPRRSSDEKRKAPMLHFDYEKAFQSLSSAEKKEGCALRIPRCVRGAGEGEVAWVVLYFCRHDNLDDVPSVRGALPVLRVESAVFGPLVQSFTPFDDECVWHVKEFEVVLPLSLRAFTIECGKASLRLTWRSRNRLLDAHYDEIAHAATDASYHEWLMAHRPKTLDGGLEEGPLMSIVVPVYRTPPSFLAAMMDSVLGQSYRKWELIVVNASPDDEGVSSVLSVYRDDRIVVIDHPENDGISGNTNVGIAAARGSYVSFLDHDDVIEPDALAAMVQVIVGAEEHVDLVYCDEDSIDEEGRYCLPLFKPPLNPDLLYSNNYVIHWLTVSREILEAVERSGREVDGAQDYDLTLKALELSRRVVRIPRVLYHWRMHAGSTNANPDSKPYAQVAGAKAIEGHFARCDFRAVVSLEEVPCTYKSIFKVVPQQDFSIICLVWGGKPSDALLQAAALYGDKTGSSSSVVPLGSDAPDQVEQALASAKEPLVFFCPSSLGEVSAESLAVMAGYFQRSDVAAVSPKVIRKDGLVDYGGACVCPDGDVMYLNRFLPAEDHGYVGRVQRPYDAFVLNPACFMVRKELLEEYLSGDALKGARRWGIGLFAECFKMNLRCVYTPFASLRDTQHKTLLDYGVAEFQPEDRLLLLQRYGELFSGGDPSHNPNFDPYSPYYRLRR